MTALMSLNNTTIIDFTGTHEGASRFSTFGTDVISLIRSSSGTKVLVVIDRGYELPNVAPYVVRDHLNLTGNNPLVGINDPCGERFPSVNNVYITDACPHLSSGVAAGLKLGVVPTSEEMSFMRSLGADFYCYNLVPTMIVAAHAGWRVLGIVLPEGTDVQPVLKDVLQLGSRGN